MVSRLLIIVWTSDTRLPTNALQVELIWRIQYKTVVESLQKIIFSIFAVISFTSVSANRTAIRAPMSSSRQIDSNFKGETRPFPQ